LSIFDIKLGHFKNTEARKQKFENEEKLKLVGSIPGLA
jgi:hypothetical protein